MGHGTQMNRAIVRLGALASRHEWGERAWAYLRDAVAGFDLALGGYVSAPVHASPMGHVTQMNRANAA